MYIQDSYTTKIKPPKKPITQRIPQTSDDTTAVSGTQPMAASIQQNLEGYWFIYDWGN